MSATVPSGDSQTIGSSVVGFTEPLNVAGELNLRGEFSLNAVTGTFTAQRPLDINSGETLAVTTTVAGSPLNLAGQLDLTGQVKLTDSPSITFTGIREPPKPGLFTATQTLTGIRAGASGSISITNTFEGGRAFGTQGAFTSSSTYTAPVGGGAAATIDTEILTTGIRAGADATATISATFDAIRSGATALPTPTEATFDGIRAGADGDITGTFAFATSPAIIPGRFGPEVSPLTIPSGQSLAVTSGSTTDDAPINVAGSLNVSGTVNTFDLDASIEFDAIRASDAATFAPALTPSAANTAVQPNTQPFAPTLSATGDNEPLGTQETSGIFLAQPTYDGGLFQTGVINAAYDPSGDPVSATSDVAPIVWQVTIDQTEVVDDVFDVEVVDTANPFGSYAVVYADDVTGNTFDKFGRGTRVDIAYSDNQGITFEDRFTGYVVEAREYDDSGSDTLEVECYTFDQFLRRNVVSEDLSGKTIEQALQTIVQNDTPVEFVQANIDVGSTKTLTRSFRGEPVEDVLRALSFASVNEEFGVNDDVEFFFRPRESEHNARGVDNTRWLNYDIPELGKDAVNEVRVFFDDGNRTVVVDDGNDQLDLQESLALESAGRQIEEISRPEITAISDAEDEGRRFLEERTSILSGTVTTFGLYDLKPGDTIDIEIQPRGIDDEFQVAEVRYHWGRSETDLTIVEKRGTSDDILFRISSSIKRIETAEADRTAIQDKILKNEYKLLVEPVDNEGKFDDIRITNTALDLLRDAVIDETTITIDEVRWGDDGTNLSRTNTDLEGTQVAAFAAGTGNWQADVSVFNTLGLSYESSETADAKEVGLFDDGGNLLIRAVSDAGVRANEIDFSITFKNDPEVERTVVTDTGQQLFRDILADNNPTFLEQYRVGEGDAAVDETDTDLDDPFAGTLGKVGLDNLQIAFYRTEDDWQNEVDPVVFDGDYPIDGPFSTGDGTFQLNLINNGYWIEAEDANSITGQVGNWSDPPAASEFESVRCNAVGEGVSHTFTMDMDHVPSETTLHVGTWFKDFDGTFEFFVNNKSVRSVTFGGATSTDWTTQGTGILSNENISAGELSKGSTVSVEAEITSYNGGEVYFDFIQLNDELERKGIPRYREINPYDPKFAGNALGILQSYNPVPVPIETITSPIDFDEVTIETEIIGSDKFVDAETTNDGPETEFRIRASNDGGNTFLQAVNQTEASFTFADSNTEVDLQIWLDGYWGDTTDGSPAGGTEGMNLNKLRVFAGIESLKRDGIGGVNARAIFRPQTITAGGKEVKEGGLFDSDGNMVCRTIAIAPFDPGSDTRVSTDDTIRLVGV